MSTEISSIDDLLATQSSPSIPPVSEDMGNDDSVAPENEYDEDVQGDEDTEQDDDNHEQDSGETDDYGNKKGAQKTYTEEEVNERINKAVRERLAREERRINQSVDAPKQSQNPNGDDWEEQLKDFVKKTVSSMNSEEQSKRQQEIEYVAQAQFEQKFHSGMGKFNDFTEIVGKQPITDAMVLATREMKDPAAFLYAASKRAPQELARISQIRDQYAQIAAMGALETSLKKTNPATKAPRPMSRTFEDGEITHKSQKEDSIEDLIYKSEKKKLAQANMRRR